MKKTDKRRVEVSLDRNAALVLFIPYKLLDEPLNADQIALHAYMSFREYVVRHVDGGRATRLHQRVRTAAGLAYYAAAFKGFRPMLAYVSDTQEAHETVLRYLESLKPAGVPIYYTVP